MVRQQDRSVLARLARRHRLVVPDVPGLGESAPSALLWGRHDRMVPLRVGQAARSSLGWPLRVIEDAGHGPHIEQPDGFVHALGEAQAAVTSAVLRAPSVTFHLVRTRS